MVDGCRHVQVQQDVKIRVYGKGIITKDPIGPDFITENENL